MPKIVDHAVRREEIARLVIRVIEKEGAEGATVRRIAQAGDFSIGVLTHYFKDKDEMVAFAFQWGAMQTFIYLDAVVAAAEPGLERLRAALAFMLPAPDTPNFIAVWLSLWGRAIRNPALAKVHGQYYEHWRRTLRRRLAEAAALGQIAAPESLRDATDLLIAGIDGLWIGATFEPRRFSLRRRRQLVDRLLAAVLGADPR
jgi:AcrR family transcriptional regulator